MIIGEALENERKKSGKDQNKKLELELLLAFVLKCDRAFLLLNYQKEILAADLKKYQHLVKKLFAGWPLAYLIGEREFYGRSFLVNPATLIPRPESEMIIDLIKEESSKYQKATLVDIGTGSGCLIISLAAELGKKFNYRALDISSKALLAAKKNAQKNKVKINFYQGDLLKNLPKQKGPIMLLANPPYLTKEQVAKEESIKKEPRSALISGKDGFKDYRRLFKQIAERPDLKNFYLIIEIDPQQKKLVKEEGKKYFPEKKISLVKDLRKKIRFAVIN